jgi:L-threonylcarbamoyladenylate synthase
MQTHILPTQESDLESSCRIAADYLKEGELVAFPTETVYGLGALLFESGALTKIFQVKGRPADNPLIAHLSSLEQVDSVAKDIPDEFFALAEKFFPGPLAIVLKKQPAVPLLATGGQESIAVRMPAHAIAQKLIETVGVPLAAPSANLSGKPSSIACGHVYEDFAGKIAAILDGGETTLGIESTVLSLLNPKEPLLLRPGRVTAEEIEAVLKRALFFPGKETPLLSPGMRYKHYAPQARVQLFFSVEELDHYLFSTPARRRSILAPVEHKRRDAFPLQGCTLYAELRRADAYACEEVLILCDADIQKDAALMNRLQRAAC